MNEKLKKYVSKKFLKVSEHLLKNPSGLKYRLKLAQEKMSKSSIKDALGGYASDLKNLIKMVKFWVNGEYRDISKESIVLIVLAIVYFITPTDFMPDFIFGMGYLDDISVLRWVVYKLQDEITKFQIWLSDTELNNTAERVYTKH